MNTIATTATPILNSWYSAVHRRTGFPVQNAAVQTWSGKYRPLLLQARLPHHRPLRPTAVVAPVASAERKHWQAVPAENEHKRTRQLAGSFMFSAYLQV